MRIAMIGHKSIFSEEGGIEKTVRQLSFYMAGKGHEVTVYDRGTCTPHAETASGQFESFRNVRIVKVPTISGAAEVPLYSFFAAVHAAFHKYDVVMFHASGPCLMLPLVKRKRTKTIAFIHGLDSKSSKWGSFARRYLSAGEKTAAKKSDKLLVLSENIRDYFKNAYGRTAEMVINGIELKEDIQDETNDKGELLNQYSLSGNGYFLWTGRISREKGLPYLISAYKKCKTDKKLVLAGKIDKRKGSYYETLLPLCQQNPNILFIGNQTPDALRILYQKAFAFVFPSEQEGMAHSLLEAQVNNAACILSDIPENKVVAQENALYFQSKNADDLKDKMQYLIDNPGIKTQLIEGQRQKIILNYSCEKSGAQILEICTNLFEA